VSLKVAAKKLQAAKLIAWQETVEAGSQGWQAAATLLERRDPGNWSRNQPTSKAKSSALSRAVKGRK
jgi:hypothetical protein